MTSPLELSDFLSAQMVLQTKACLPGSLVIRLIIHVVKGWILVFLVKVDLKTILLASFRDTKLSALLGNPLNVLNAIPTVTFDYSRFMKL